MIREFEKNRILPVLLRELPKHVGRAQALKLKEIASALNNWSDVKITEFSAKLLVEHIIINQLVHGLVVDGSLVYVSTNSREYALYIERLDAKIKHLCCMREAAKKQLALF